MKLSRGNIVLCKVPMTTTELKEFKLRPGLIVSKDFNNKRLDDLISIGLNSPPLAANRPYVVGCLIPRCLRRGSSLIKQLPPEHKRAALFVLAEEASARRETRLDYAEAQLQRLCAERGLNWDKMDEQDVRRS